MQNAVVKRINQLCNERDITRHQLARDAGIPPSTFFSIERQNDIRLSTIKKVCDALDITLGQFFSSNLFDTLPPLE